MGRARGLAPFLLLAALMAVAPVPVPAPLSAAGPSAGAASPTAPAPAPRPAPVLDAGQTATVTYCNHQRARITEPARFRARTAPAAVYVHGGSWVSGDYDTGGFIIDRIGPALAAAGFVVVSLDYRLGPRRHWPDQIVDVKCAIRYLRANAPHLHLNRAEIGAWGQSAGGHLVALLATAGRSAGWDVGAYHGESSEVQSVVDMAGPSDLLAMGDRGDARAVAKSFISLLGNVTARQLDGDLSRASPVAYVAHGDPPFLVLDSNDDEIVSPQQSEELAHDLATHDVPHRLVTVTDGGHAFDTPGQSPSQTGVVDLVVDYFVQTLVFHQDPGRSG